MKIDKKLNIVAPVETDAGTVYVHSTPISRDVFEAHAKVMAKTFSTIYGDLGSLSGARVAALLLKEVAEQMGRWAGPEGVEQTLVNEIKRMTNIFVPRADGKGWQLLPYDSDQARAILDEDDYSEVDGMLVFFTLVSSLHRKAEVRGHLEAAGKYWGFAPTSLNATAYQRSLETLQTEETLPTNTTDETMAGTPLSSIPS